MNRELGNGKESSTTRRRAYRILSAATPSLSEAERIRRLRRVKPVCLSGGGCCRERYAGFSRTGWPDPKNHHLSTPLGSKPLRDPTLLLEVFFMLHAFVAAV
jgi:hypothetical protein